MAYIQIGNEKYEISDVVAKGIVNGCGSKQNPYWHKEDIHIGDEYFFIDAPNYLTSWGIDEYKEYPCEDEALDNAQLVKDIDYAKQQWLRETLNRKLARFSYDNRSDGGNKATYSIAYRTTDTGTAFYVNETTGAFVSLGTVAFANAEVAERAIDEVIQPFIAENPDFRPNI